MEIDHHHPPDDGGGGAPEASIASPETNLHEQPSTSSDHEETTAEQPVAEQPDDIDSDDHCEFFMVLN